METQNQKIVVPRALDHEEIWDFARELRNVIEFYIHCNRLISDLKLHKLPVPDDIVERAKELKYYSNWKYFELEKSHP